MQSFSSEAAMVMVADIWDEADADITTVGAEAVTVDGDKLTRPKCNREAALKRRLLSFSNSKIGLLMQPNLLKSFNSWARRPEFCFRSQISWAEC